MGTVFVIESLKELVSAGSDPNRPYVDFPGRIDGVCQV